MDTEKSETSSPRSWIRAVPNALTVLRLGLAAWFPFSPPQFRLAIVVAAGLSDLLDGYIARRFHAETPLGALLDRIADKGFVVTVLLTWVWEGELQLWQVLLVMARDLLVGALALVAILRRDWSAFGRMQVRMPGKVTTALLFLWFGSLLVPWARPAEPVLFWCAAAASVAAALDYGGRFVAAVRAGLPEDPDQGENDEADANG